MALSVDMASDVTTTQLFTVAAYGLVVIQLGVAAASIAIVTTLAFKAGPSRYMYLYTYEVGFVLLYAHFIVTGPPHVSTSFWNLLYWSVILGTAPLNIAPVVFEWRHLAAFYPKRIAMSVTSGLLYALLFSLIISSVLAWIIIVLDSTTNGGESLNESLTTTYTVICGEE